MFSLASADHKHLIVFDLEWNQSSYNPNHRMPHEIIEIGACRVDRNYRVVDTFSEVICPRVYKKLDKHIKSVTGITEAELAAFAEFQSLCRILLKNLHVRVDFSVGNDLKYYSGVVFKGYLEGIPAAVLSGGQYDKLLQKLGRTSGAIGFAVYLDLLERREETEYDVDTVLLHEKEADPAALVEAAEALAEKGTLLAAKEAPEGVQYRRLLKLTERGIEPVENG